MRRQLRADVLAWFLYISGNIMCSLKRRMSGVNDNFATGDAHDLLTTLPSWLTVIDTGFSTSDHEL